MANDDFTKDNPRYETLTAEQIDKLAYVDIKKWREHLKSTTRKNGVSESQKEIFLNFYHKTGKKGLSAMAAGLTIKTVDKHFKSDPQFMEAADTLFTVRSELIVEKIESEFINGHKEPVFNKEGDLLGYRTKFETAGRLKILERYDTAYQKNEETINNTSIGGVLVVPDKSSPDQWLKQAQKVKDKMIEAGNIEGGR
jgi:hypothetical protein